MGFFSSSCFKEFLVCRVSQIYECFTMRGLLWIRFFRCVSLALGFQITSNCMEINDCVKIYKETYTIILSSVVNHRGEIFEWLASNSWVWIFKPFDLKSLSLSSVVANVRIWKYLFRKFSKSCSSFLIHRPRHTTKYILCRSLFCKNFSSMKNRKYSCFVHHVINQNIINSWSLLLIQTSCFSSAH